MNARHGWLMTFRAGARRVAVQTVAFCGLICSDTAAGGFPMFRVITSRLAPSAFADQ